METYYIFTLTTGPDKDLSRSREIIAYIKKHKLILKNSGINVLIEKITYEQLTDSNVQKLLTEKYGIEGLPALYIPPNKKFGKEVFSGLSKIKEYLDMAVNAGKAAAVGQLEQFIEPETDIEQYWKTDLTVEQAEKSGNEPDDNISAGMNHMEIHKKTAAYNNKKGGRKEEQFADGIEADNSKNSKQQGKPDNIAPPKSRADGMKTAAPAFRGNTDDDDLLSQHFANNVSDARDPNY
jgi:hypothetical protein